jgi:hypothetical protein
MNGLNEEVAGPVGGGDDEGGQQTPPGWKQTNLTDVLTPPQMRQLQLILKKHKDPDAALVAMKQYFQSIAKELEAKGIVADYLAYVLYAKITGIIP